MTSSPFYNPFQVDSAPKPVLDTTAVPQVVFSSPAPRKEQDASRDFDWVDVPETRREGRGRQRTRTHRRRNTTR